MRRQYSVRQQIQAADADAGTDPQCYKSGSMIPSFIGVLTFLNAFFHSLYSLGLEILALRQQLGALNRKHPCPQIEIGSS